MSHPTWRVSRLHYVGCPYGILREDERPEF